MGQKNNANSADSLRLTALTLDQVVKVLSAAGGKQVTEQAVRQDLDAGAPVNPDGTVNLVHYASWLVRQVASGD